MSFPIGQKVRVKRNLFIGNEVGYTPVGKLGFPACFKDYDFIVVENTNDELVRIKFSFDESTPVWLPINELEML